MGEALPKPTEQQEDLSALHPAELAKLLYQQARPSARAMEIYQELSTKLALEDIKRSMTKSRWDEVRRTGSEARQSNAERMREAWKHSAILTHLSGYMTREQIIAALVKFNEKRFRGRGSWVGERSVRAWLTVEMDEQLRREADALRIQGITAEVYEQELRKQPW